MSRQKVQGVGGVFLRAKSPNELMKWYEDKLGINREWDHGSCFHWRKADRPEEKALTVWSLFEQNTDYFGSQEQQAMINYRVDNLDAFLAQLEAEGAEILPKREQSEYGSFAWVRDPENNLIELWQPPKEK